MIWTERNCRLGAYKYFQHIIYKRVATYPRNIENPW